MMRWLPAVQVVELNQQSVISSSLAERGILLARARKSPLPMCRVSDNSSVAWSPIVIRSLFWSIEVSFEFFSVGRITKSSPTFTEPERTFPEICESWTDSTAKRKSMKLPAGFKWRSDNRSCSVSPVYQGQFTGIKWTSRKLSFLLACVKLLENSLWASAEVNDSMWKMRLDTPQRLKAVIIRLYLTCEYCSGLSWMSARFDSFAWESSDWRLSLSG